MSVSPAARAVRVIARSHTGQFRAIRVSSQWLTGRQFLIQRKKGSPPVTGRKYPRLGRPDPAPVCHGSASGSRERRTNQRTLELLASGYQRIRGLRHRLPRIANLSHSRARAQSRVLHLTDESTRVLSRPRPTPPSEGAIWNPGKCLYCWYAWYKYTTYMTVSDVNLVYTRYIYLSYDILCHMAGNLHITRYTTMLIPSIYLSYDI
jgi:hypothetical protein